MHAHVLGGCRGTQTEGRRPTRWLRRSNHRSVKHASNSLARNCGLPSLVMHRSPCGQASSGWAAKVGIVHMGTAHGPGPGRA